MLYLYILFSNTEIILESAIGMAVSQLPPPPLQVNEECLERRIWIGNIDTHVTESVLSNDGFKSICSCFLMRHTFNRFALLKLVQKYGSLEKLDFIYHQTGPDKGKPRGYCFVTYENIEVNLTLISRSTAIHVQWFRDWS